MKEEDKLNILKVVLSKFGLSIEDKDVHDFFYGHRRCFRQEEYNDDGVKCEYSSAVAPFVRNVTPMDFENSGYFEGEHYLIEWFMYENSGSNPLVWNNIGNPTFDILDSYKKTRKFAGPIRQSLDGKLYNGEDANHRLLTLIINHFLELKAAKSEEEIEEVNRKYTMELEVSVPINAKLGALLERETDKFRNYENSGSVYPGLARSYRFKTFQYARDAFYAVKFDPETEQFAYCLNGETFEGTEKELIEFLKNKEERLEPIMQWEVEGVYYISCNNKIYKSKNKEKIEELYPKLKQGYYEDKIEYGEFVEIKDMDTLKYSIEFPSYYIENIEEAKYFADTIRHFITNEQETFFCKLQNAESVKNVVEENIEQAFSFLGGFSMCDLVYENLNKEEYCAIRKIMFALDEQLNWARNTEV